MKIFAFVFRQSPVRTLLAVLVGVLGGLASAALIAVINSTLKAGAQPQASLATFLGVIAVILVSGFTSRILMSQLSEQTTYDLRMRLCRQVAATPLRQLEQIGEHRIVATLSQDVINLTNAQINFPSACINGAILIGCLGYLGWLSPGVLAVVVVFLALAVVSVRLPESYASRQMRRARTEWDRLVAHFQSLVRGIKELQLHRGRRQGFLDGPLAQTADRYRRHNLASINTYAATNSWGQVLYFLLIGLLLFGFRRFGDASTEVLTGYTLTTLYIRGPLVALLDLLPMLGRGRISLQKIDDLGFSLAPLPSSVTPAQEAPRPALRQIDLVGVVHSYFSERDEKEFTLGPIDLTLRPGELLFLVGGNGSGKTTLAKVLAGLYTPTQGEIRFNGEKVEAARIDEYRQNFAAIFSDFHLFEALLGLRPIEGNFDRTVRRYLARLQLERKVEVTNGVLSTTSLSQGQRKRLALLTAFLEERPVYVFDEWAADQDPEFREFFYRTLLPELRAAGRAVLVISHDDRYFDLADRLVKLDYGKVVEVRERSQPAVPAQPQRPAEPAAVQPAEVG
jgi:putative ATP-binding cassette transporter